MQLDFLSLFTSHKAAAPKPQELSSPTETRAPLHERLRQLLKGGATAGLDSLREKIEAVAKPAEEKRPAAGARKTCPPRWSDPALIAKARELLAAIGCDELAARVDVRWNPRMRSTAGTAYAMRMRVTLNPKIREFGEAEVDRTLRHELAHLLAYYRAGRRSIAAHGPEWKKACADLGIAGEERCHTLPLPRRQIARKHAYRCPRCEIIMHRVRPLKRKSACLACCRRYSGGRYDDRFRLVKVPMPTGE